MINTIIAEKSFTPSIQTKSESDPRSAQELHQYEPPPLTPAQVLILAKISSLPVDIFVIAKHFEIAVLPFSYLAKFDYVKTKAKKTPKATNLKAKNPFGFTVQLAGKNVIFYDEFQEKLQIRWTIAHELAHIFLNHTKAHHFCSGPQEKRKKSIYDIEADIFAGELLCPYIVLHMCSVSTSKELKSLASVSTTASQIAFEKLTFLRKNQGFFEKITDKILYTSFSSFISTAITKKLVSAQQSDDKI